MGKKSPQNKNKNKKKHSRRKLCLTIYLSVKDKSSPSFPVCFQAHVYNFFLRYYCDHFFQALCPSAGAIYYLSFSYNIEDKEEIFLPSVFFPL